MAKQKIDRVINSLFGWGGGIAAKAFSALLRRTSRIQLRCTFGDSDPKPSKNPLVEEWALAWLGKRFLNRTFSPQEDDPIVDVDEIIEILDAKLNDSSTKRESNPPYL